MEKDTFTVIVVPHDPQKTRNYKIPYRLLYVLVTFAGIGLVAMVIFIATYGQLLLKARESVLLAGQVEELTKRNEQVGEVLRNLSELHAMDLKVRQMLGVDIAEGDSLAMLRNLENEELTDREVESSKEQIDALTKERDELSEQAKEGQRVVVRATVKEAIANTDLPEPSKKRLIQQFESVEASDELGGLIEKAVAAEKQYLTDLAESGKVKDLGENKKEEEDGVKELRETIVKSHILKGVTPERAKELAETEMALR